MTTSPPPQLTRAEEATEARNRNLQLLVGGKLVENFHLWRRFFTDYPEVLRKVAQGVLLQFSSEAPTLTRTPIPLFSRRRLPDLQAAAEKLQRSGAIEEVLNTNSPGFYSRLFLVPKQDGAWRPVIDLSTLNRLLLVPTFKMETVFTIVSAVRQGEWVAKLDLKDAYHHVQMHPSTKKFLRFVIGQTTYQFKVLPFGLSSAPREFTKTLAPIVHYLRTQGFFLHAYLDDWLIRANSPQQVVEAVQMTVNMLENLGWTINWSKSQTFPSQTITYLGLSFNLLEGTVSPPSTFRDSVRRSIQEFRPSSLHSARAITSVIDRVKFFAPFIKRGRLHLRPLQMWLQDRWSQASQSWDAKIPVDEQLQDLLSWFLGPQIKMGIPLTQPPYQETLFTDASLTGWGAAWDDNHLSGSWPQSLASAHINWLEMEAVRLALWHWGHLWAHKTIRVFSDNRTVVAFIKKEGGTRSRTLVSKVIEIYDILDLWDITLQVSHLAGSRNVTADALSRMNKPSPSEWCLNHETLNKVFSAWGQPLIDMFATFQNKVTPIFVCPFPDDRAWRVDALSFDWDNLGLVYAFPPAPIVKQTLDLIRQSKGTTVILIVSDSPARPWHPDLLELSDAKLKLEDLTLYQYLPHQHQPVYHCNPCLMSLAAWRLSSRH